MAVLLPTTSSAQRGVGRLAARGEHLKLPLFPVTEIWKLSLPTALGQFPAFDDRLAYLPLSDGHLAAYRLATGEPVWTRDVDVVVEPAVGDGLLFVATADALSALHAADGSPAWSIDAADLSAPLVWKSGWLLAASSAGSLSAYRAGDGALIWRRELGAPLHARVTVAGDRVYAPLADARILALAVGDGALIWDHRVGGAASEVAATDDRVYVGSVDNFFYCLNASDGNELWRWRTGADVVGAPVLDDRRVYFVSLDNVLRALDRRTGNQRWLSALPLRPSTGPLLEGPTLLVSGLAPTVRAFAVADGRAAGEFTAAGDLAAPPHVIATPGTPLPLLVVMSGNPARGTTVVALMHDIEPAIVPVGPLPGLVTVGPAGASGP